MKTQILRVCVVVLTLMFSQGLSATESSEPVTSEDSFVLITNSSTKVDAITQRELRSLFSLRRGVWSDGSKVTLVTLPDGHRLHKQFIEKRLKLFPYQLKRVWDRQIFSGSAVRPTNVKTINELIAFVASTEGAIGYCPVSDMKAIKNEQVKIITVN